MNREMYLNNLKTLLSGMPQEELNDILYDYEEHFRIGINDGKTEEEISQSLGDPKTVAKQYKAYNTIKTATTDTTAKNTIKAVFAIGVLGFFNLVFVLGPFIGIAAALFSFYVVGAAVTLAGIAAIAAVFIAPFVNFIDIGINSFSAMCFSIFTVAFGILFFIMAHFINRWFYKYTVKYLNWNLQFFRK